MSNLVQIPHPSKKKCTVHGCPTPIAATIHKFPKTDIEKVNLWRQICGVTKKASNLFICSNHFEAKDFYNSKFEIYCLKIMFYNFFLIL